MHCIQKNSYRTSFVQVLYDQPSSIILEFDEETYQHVDIKLSHGGYPPKSLASSTSCRLELVLPTDHTIGLHPQSGLGVRKLKFSVIGPTLSR